MTFNTSLRAKNRGSRSGSVKFIVLHDTAGSGTANDAKYLANDPEHRGISVDFCIVKDGTVFQLNDDLKGHCTFHAGRHTNFRGILNGAVNQHSIGIEIAQKADMKGLDPVYPEVQVKAVAEVCRYICNVFGLTKLDITTHAKIITDGSRSDPRSFPWEDFWAIFNSNDPSIEGVHEAVTHIVQEGDTLFSLARTYSTTVERIKALNGMNDASNTIIEGTTLIVRE